MKNKFNPLGILVLITIFCGLLYVACGGILLEQIDRSHKKAILDTVTTEHFLLDSVDYANRYALETVLLNRDFREFYPQYENLPDLMIFMLASMAMGGIGVLLRELYDPKKDSLLGNRLLIGAIIGLTVLLIGDFSPNKIFPELNVSYSYIFIVALISGMFTDKFIKWMGRTFDKIYK